MVGCSASIRPSALEVLLAIARRSFVISGTFVTVKYSSFASESLSWAESEESSVNSSSCEDSSKRGRN